MTKIADFEVVDHGPEFPQYFQGQGTVFTRFLHCVTGAGDSQREAFEDALEQIAMAFDHVDFTELDAVAADYSDETDASELLGLEEDLEADEYPMYYLSVLFNLPTADEAAA